VKGGLEKEKNKIKGKKRRKRPAQNSIEPLTDKRNVKRHKPSAQALRTVPFY
jgi:hypothetical protein